MELTSTELMELQRQASARNGRADSARHARLILLLNEGLTWAEIRAKLDCSDRYIARWSKRCAAELAKAGMKVSSRPMLSFSCTQWPAVRTIERLGVASAVPEHE